MSGFVLHPEAYTDLNDIWDYIAADSLDAADRVIEEIYSAIKSLVSFPRRGYRRSELTSRPVRFLPVREYVIAYAAEEKPIVVLAVLHGRRNPRLIAALLRARHE